ncbi:hypothetical protein B0T19DRAFT_87782 [Cercophora scortea]|uniref:Uncharacterized protein n=1 Tax=Cercophora scortea TaxID=314031 RepID=A0AAE0IV84_9PEZI|nr:hypothetical protein B0T19DRAFT_87782 [Cercophora scortea]
MNITLPIITQIILATNNVDMRTPKPSGEAETSQPPDDGDDDDNYPIRAPPPVSGPVDLAVFGNQLDRVVPPTVLKQSVLPVQSDTWQMVGGNLNIFLDGLSTIEIEERLEMSDAEIVRDFGDNGCQPYNSLLLLIVGFIALACRMRVIARHLVSTRRYREAIECESVVKTLKNIADIMLDARRVVEESLQVNMGVENAETLFREELKTVHKHLWAVGRFWETFGDTFHSVFPSSSWVETEEDF